MIVAICRRLVGLFIVISASTASAGETLLLANGLTGDPTHSAGVAVSSLIKLKLLPSDGIDVQTLNSAGVLETVRLLRDGEADIAILPSTIGHAARLGIGSFEGNAPLTGFRAVTALWRDALHLVVRAEDAKTGTIDDVVDMAAPRLFLGDASTGMVDANRLLFSEFGMNADPKADLAVVETAGGIAAIKRGDIDALSLMAATPEPMFDTIFDASGSALRLLKVDEDQLTRVNGNHWLWTPFTIPTDTYPGQQDDIDTIALSNLLVVRTDVEQDVVYRLTRSLFENLAYLENVDPVLADLSLENALAGVVLPLHPGALRYYQEAGVIPAPTADNAPASPEVTPALQDGNTPRGLPVERYPDEDVAARSQGGVGGPLVPAPVDKTEANLPSPSTSEPQLQPKSNWWTPPSHWRRRATL
jgi:TRAP transporter TAXI family solute receptor